MSMEIFVLSDRRLNAIGDWQRAIDRRGSPLRLSDAIPFADQRGGLPAVLRDRATAFECDHWDADTLVAETPDVAFGRHWRYALAFRWGGDMAAGEAAYLAAAAYAEATDGRILDCAEGALVSPERAAIIAAEFETSGPLIEEALRRMIEGIGKS
jgi:hypothetical protein